MLLLWLRGLLIILRQRCQIGLLHAYTLRLTPAVIWGLSQHDHYSLCTGRCSPRETIGEWIHKCSSPEAQSLFYVDSTQEVRFKLILELKK